MLPGGGQMIDLCVYVCMQFDTDCFHFLSAYTNDVVLAVERSQMLICVLSAEYLSNTHAVYILESGLQVGEKSQQIQMTLWKIRSEVRKLWMDI